MDLVAIGTVTFDPESSGSDPRAIVIGRVMQVPPPPEQSPSPIGAVSCRWSHAFFPRCRTGAEPSRGEEAAFAGVSASLPTTTGGVAGGAGGVGAGGGAADRGGDCATAGTGVAGAGLAVKVKRGAGEAPAARSGASTLPSAEGTRTSQGGPGA